MFELKEMGKCWPTFSQELMGHKETDALVTIKNRLKGCWVWPVCCEGILVSLSARELLSAVHQRMGAFQSSKKAHSKIEQKL